MFMYEQKGLKMGSEGQAEVMDGSFVFDKYDLFISTPTQSQG